MRTALRDKLRRLLHELHDDGVKVVVLLKEENHITWLGNVTRAEAEMIATKVGDDLTKPLSRLH